MKACRVIALFALSVLVITGCRSPKSSWWQWPDSDSPTEPLNSCQICAGARSVYVLSPGGKLTVLDRQTGHRNWQVDLQRDLHLTPWSLHVEADGAVLISDLGFATLLDERGKRRWRNNDFDGAKIALDSRQPNYVLHTGSALVGVRADGTIAWRLPGSFSMFSRAGQRVVAMSDEAAETTIVSLSALNGVEFWRWSAPPHRLLADVATLGDVTAALQCTRPAANSIDALASPDWNFRTYWVEGLDAEGQLLWSVELPGRFFSATVLPAPGANVLFVQANGFAPGRQTQGTNQQLLFCLSGKGELLWQKDITSARVSSTVIAGGVCFFGTETGQVVSCSPAGTLAVVAEYEPGKLPRPRLTVVAVGESDVVCLVNGRTLARLPRLR